MDRSILLFIGCDPADLTNQNMDGNPDNSVCAKGETPLFISGGTVCYSGTTPGSTAVYHCGEGYELVGEKNTRQCKTNGNWGGATPTCTCKQTMIIGMKQLEIINIYSSMHSY